MLLNLWAIKTAQAVKKKKKNKKHLFEPKSCNPGIADSGSHPNYTGENKGKQGLYRQKP